MERSCRGMCLAGQLGPKWLDHGPLQTTCLENNGRLEGFGCDGRTRGFHTCVVALKLKELLEIVVLRVLEREDACNQTEDGVGLRKGTNTRFSVCGYLNVFLPVGRKMLQSCRSVQLRSLWVATRRRQRDEEQLNTFKMKSQDHSNLKKISS